jgi:hypothetical protein
MKITLRKVWITLAAITFAVLAYRLYEGRWLLRPDGEPIVNDFLTFWAGGIQTWQGHAAQVYDLKTHTQVQRHLLGDAVPFNPLPYPPYFFFFMLPFAALPYYPALAAFLVLTIAGYAAALKVIVRDWITAIAMTLSFGGAYFAFYYVQAPFLIGALLVGGLALMPTRPIAAGVLFGMLTVKPHLGVALAVALLLSREWKTIAAAVGTTLILILTATIAFGPGIWSAYWESSYEQFEWLVAGPAWIKASSVYVSFSPFLGEARALIIHIVSAVLALVVMATLWKRETPYGNRAAAVIAATLLMSPYLYPYDAVMLTGAAAFVLSREGVLVEQKALIVLASVLPGLAFIIYGAAIPLAAWLMLYLSARHAPLSPHAGSAARQQST